MKDELEKSENLLSEAKEKKASMRKEAIVQANYSAAMGSILGTMLWRTSKTADVIDTFISEVSESVSNNSDLFIKVFFFPRESFAIL